MKRNHLDICADILKVSKNGAKKTHVVYKANLNFKIVNKYLVELMDQEFLENDGDMFFLTEKGQDFIERYESLVLPFNNRINGVGLV
ncbi:MAG: winged helix-turn-helix domain-containing protein [Candidatus Bathyarchaeia archaeon]